MGAAKKLASTEAYVETGTVEPIGAEGPGSFAVRLATGTFGARRAKSCLVAPEAGDRVLCAIEGDGVYIIAVLAGREGAPTKIAADGDLTLEARGGRVAVRGHEGVDVATAGAVGLTGAEVHVRAKTGTVAVGELGFFGKLVQAEVGKVAVLAEHLDSVVTRLSVRAKRVFRFVEDLDQTRAGTVDVRAQTLLGLRAENAVISARVLTKVDGEQIHLG
jgi:Protein of unknown function (DUF3540)